MKLIAFLAFSSLLIAGSMCEEDHDPIHEEHYHHGDHNSDYDHEAVLGSKELEDEFDHLDPDEAKQKLSEIILKMDKDGDKNITKDELADWIMASYKTLDEEDAKGKFDEADGNGDKKVSWAEYLVKVHGFTPDEVVNMTGDASMNSTDSKKMLKSIAQDHERFQLADKDGSGFLLVDEYAPFVYPSYYSRMHELELAHHMAEYDADENGYISMPEYVGEHDDKEQEVIDQENFKNMDLNKDGKLSSDEVRGWAIPDHKKSAIGEAKHLIAESDQDKDGKLSSDEILENYELWVGSAAHPSLHDPEEL